MKHALVVLIFLAACLCAAEKIQESDWKTGVLLDQNSETTSKLIGNNGSFVQQKRTHTYYMIDGGEMIYVAARETRPKWDHPLNVTVNGPIKYAIKGHSVYLMDDDGKTHKLSLEKKILKPKPENK